MCSLSLAGRIGLGIGTLGQSEAVRYGLEKVEDAINQPPDLINSHGDKLSDQDKSDLSFDKSKTTTIHTLFGDTVRAEARDPGEKAKMLLNWLTGGGAPKPVDPGVIYAKAEGMSGAQAKGAAGSGVGGLFGQGLLVGDLTPKEIPVGGKLPLVKGVPYSTAAVPAPAEGIKSFDKPGGGL